MKKNQNDPKVQAMARQLTELNVKTPTGMKNYLERSRGLLAASAKGENPFDKYKPEVPNGVFLKAGSE